MANRALLIANSRYDDGYFTDLPAAAVDAEALAEVLADPDIGDFAVTRLVDVEQRRAMRALESFFADAKPDDLLLLHMSLHGWKDLRNRLYFVVRDTERDFLGSTAISAEFVSDRMAQSRSRRIVLMLDCCYSGAFTIDMLHRAAGPVQVDIAEPFAGNGRVVLTASTSLQFAHEGEQNIRFSWTEAQPSVFTAAVVRGLRDGAADLDGDGLVSVDELYDYVHEQVRRRVPGQTPTLSVAKVQGTIYLARSTRVTGTEGDLLGELRSATADPQAWKRVGALHLIERLLGSIREPARDAARTALLRLVADTDPEVASRARELWHARGLGDVPTAEPARRRPPRLRPTTGAVGIDFGTTNSSVAVLDGEDVRLVPNAEGALVTPSVVALTADGGTLVGAVAQRQAMSNPDYTVRAVKLKLGTDWSIERDGKRYTAEDIAAFLLARLREDAESYLGGPVPGVIITVPAYFDHVQRRALAEAAARAGVNIMRIINEPTAAAVTFGLNRVEEQTVLIFDLGGGTLDVSLLELGEGVCEVKATAGDNRLGGGDWDDHLVAHLTRRIHERHRVTIDRAAAQRLREAAEAAKIELSSSTVAELRLPYFADGPAGPIHVQETLTRDEFETLTRGVLERCRRPVLRAVQDAGITLADVDHVIIVGGASRMPAVGRLVEELTGGKKPYRGIIPEGVVTGAALQAGVLVGAVKDMLLLDVAPMSLGIESRGGRFTTVIDRNTTIPTRMASFFGFPEATQTSVVLRILEGEQAMAKHNRTLAMLELSDLTPASSGVPRIAVVFDIDANGTLNVSAGELRGSDGELPARAEEMRRRIRAAGPVSVADLFAGRAASLTVDRIAVEDARRPRTAPVGGLVPWTPP